MKFCSQCGSPVKQEIPEMDNRLRYVCPACKTIHYENPKVIAGALPIHDGRILLCKRAIEPRHGYWTLPAGFMENEETTPQAAQRETLEEANARVSVHHLISMIDVPYISQVHMFFHATLDDLDFSAGEESLEVDLFKPSEIPWDEIAFATVKKTLQHFLHHDRLSDESVGHIPLLVDHIEISDRMKKLIEESKND
jgi:ADP-ribose pyrophosphatase YjhB (NUDIX family)